MNEFELLESLPENAEDAFPIYEEYMREKFITSYETNNGYSSPDHMRYMRKIIAFLKEHKLDIGLSYEIPYLEKHQEAAYFTEAENLIEIHATRFNIARARKNRQAILPYYVLEPAKKTEIHHHIIQIRTLIEGAELSISKKESLFTRLNALSLEVDKDKSRGETIMGIFTLLTKSAGEGMDKINQALSHTQKIMEAYAKSSEAPLIQITFNNKPAIEAPKKQIENSNKSDEMADDIPF